jgi:anoctamin-4
MRELLTTEWASFKNLLYVQPFDAIKNYLGEQIGLYFAFMGFYVYYLVLMTILGLIVFLYGIIFTMSGKDPYINEIKNDDRLLCPKCNGNCDYFPLSLRENLILGS